MFNKLSEVIEYYQDYGLTGKHRYQYRADSLGYFDAYQLKELRRLHIKQYAKLRRYRVTNATINRELSFARAAINCVMQDYEIVLNNPFEKIKFIEDDYIPNYLTRQEYLKLLTAAKLTDHHELHDFIVLLTMTGCRPIELLTLKWENVHLDKKQFIVRNHYSKTKKTLYKYLNNTALELLERKLRLGDFVFTNPKTGKAYTTFTKSFARCKKRANVNCTMYDLRHTYASWLVQDGVNIYMVKELLGHSDIDSTMRYAHLDYQSLLSAVDKIG